MSNSWVLVANASEASLYLSHNLRKNHIKLLKKFEHPESRQKDHDLVSDAPGRYKSDRQIGSAYEKTEPKMIEADNFARTLAHMINQSYNESTFDELLIVASPHFYGLLNKHINAHIPQVEHLAKDYTKCDIKELGTHIRNHVYK